MKKIFLDFQYKNPKYEKTIVILFSALPLCLCRMQ